MFLDNRDLEFLKLCGLARYMPRRAIDKYDIPLIEKETVAALLRAGYIKFVSGGCKCYRLTRKGRDILMKAGYAFPDDARPHKKGSIFDRRVINAELNMLLYGAGINIYAGTVEGLGDAEYIPSLTIRADTKSKVLAGTRFYGILHKGDTAYVLYYAGRNSAGIFPRYEEETFLSLISRIGSVKHISVIIAAETVEGLQEIISPDKTLKMDNGMVSFSELTERWQYDFCLLPMDKDGILQMKYITVNNARKNIAAKFGDINNVPNNLHYFDAVSGGKAYITAMDMNITRVTNALLQALEVDVTPHIICLPHQQALYQNVAIKLQYPKLIKFTRIHIDKLTELFPAFLPAQMPLMPARTKEGGCLKI